MAASHLITKVHPAGRQSWACLCFFITARPRERGEAGELTKVGWSSTLLAWGLETLSPDLETWVEISPRTSQDSLLVFRGRGCPPPGPAPQRTVHGLTQGPVLEGLMLF